MKKELIELWNEYLSILVSKGYYDAESYLMSLPAFMTWMQTNKLIVDQTIV
jgi:hypothetical protein